MSYFIGYRRRNGEVSSRYSGPDFDQALAEAASDADSAGVLAAWVRCQKADGTLGDFLAVYGRGGALFINHHHTDHNHKDI